MPMKQILRPLASAAFFTAAMRCRLDANCGREQGAGRHGGGSAVSAIAHQAVQVVRRLLEEGGGGSALGVMANHQLLRHPTTICSCNLPDPPAICHLLSARAATASPARPPHLRGDDASLALVPHHPVDQAGLHQLLAGGAPRCQHVGGV